MSWSNYHGHCHYCDGKEAPEEYIRSAMDKGMHAIGFSCHAPVPFQTTWNMPASKLPVYLEEIDRLKQNNGDELIVLKSLEVDFIPDVIGPRNQLILDSELDYMVGSVHFVDAFDDGTRWSIDNNNSEFVKGVNEIFDGDVQAAITRYFYLQNEMLTTQPPEILGHMDKIRMHNVVSPHFDENAKWYRNLVYETLKLAAQNEVVVEINTKYFSKTEMTFPSMAHFKWMLNNNVRVTINSDAHHPDALTSGFSEVAGMLLNAGYRHLWHWVGGAFCPKLFDGNGVINK